MNGEKIVDGKFTLNGTEFDSALLTHEQQKLLIKLLFCRNKVGELNVDMENLIEEIQEIEDDVERFVLINSC